MTATFTNPDNGATIQVFVQERFEQHGEQWARVNKGAAKSPMAFNVRAEALS